MADSKKKKPTKTYAELIAETDAMIAELEKLTAKPKTKSRRENKLAQLEDAAAMSMSRMGESARKHSSLFGRSPASQAIWELTRSPRATGQRIESLNRADDAKRGGFRMAPHPSRVAILKKALKKKK